MDSGLIQILVIAFFIIISMMDGAARKKRREVQRQEAQRRGEVGPGEGRAGAGERGSMKTERMSDGHEPTSEGWTSEGMVPDELWAEIAALARGGPAPSTRRLPPTRVPEPEETSLRPEHQHVEMHDHVEWEPEEGPAYPVVPASVLPAPVLPDRAGSRALSEAAEVLPAADLDERPRPAPQTLGKGQGVRRTLKHGGSASIRQAVILAEVLGPPTALRGFGHEPPG